MIFKIVVDFENKLPTRYHVLSGAGVGDICGGKTLESFATYTQADAFVATLLEEYRRTFYDKLLKKGKNKEKKSFLKETIQSL